MNGNIDCLRRDEFVSGNIFIRPVFLHNSGSIPGHTHNFDHTTIFLSGKVVCEMFDAEGQDLGSQVFQAPAYLLIKKGIRHKMTCLSDNALFWCVYSHRDKDGMVLEDVPDVLNPHELAAYN